MLLRLQPVAGPAQIFTAPRRAGRATAESEQPVTQLLHRQGYFKRFGGYFKHFVFLLSLWLPGEVAACQGRLPRPVCRAMPAASCCGSADRRRGAGSAPQQPPRSRRVPKATAGGKAGAPAPALLLSHVGLSQGLAPSHPNHLWSGDNEP